MGFFNRLKSKFIKEENKETTTTYKKGMNKTRQSFTEKLNDMFARYRQVDEEFFEELEEALIMADVGVMTVMDLIDDLKFEVQRRNIKDPKEMNEVISEKLVEIYYNEDDPAISELNIVEDDLTVILVVGVNGVGKTTSIGKLAAQFKNEGKHVMLAAGDTFRAGAIEQLEEWGKRSDIEVIKQSEGSDPAAVIFDGIKAAKSRNADVLICDTAGRLQNKVDRKSTCLNSSHVAISYAV